MLRRALIALVVAVLAGCGVSAQDTSEPVPTGVRSPAQTAGGDRAIGARLTVYLVRGADLAPVERRLRDLTAEAALAELVEGPTRAEAADGVRTALPPEVVGVEDVLSDGTATVSVTRGFTGITGGNQLLAVAQVVWTLTDLATVERVRFAVEGVAVEVPTDAGLSAGPVDRDDYRTVAPVPPPPGPEETPPPPAEEGSTTGSSAPPR